MWAARLSSARFYFESFRGSIAKGVQVQTPSEGGSLLSKFTIIVPVFAAWQRIFNQREVVSFE